MQNTIKAKKFDQIKLREIGLEINASLYNLPIKSLSWRQRQNKQLWKIYIYTEARPILAFNHGKILKPSIGISWFYSDPQERWFVS